MDNIYSAYHYACKTKADKEAVEQIYDEVKKSAQNAIYRNIGDIFFTARTDTEINGAVECNGGTYSTADFEGKQNVGNLLASGSLPYVSLEEYANLVSSNGSCRAFGWDGGKSFRVPTIPALLLTKEQSAVVGNGMTLGLTNGTQNFGLAGNSSTSYYLQSFTSAYGQTVGTSAGGNGTTTNVTEGVTTDPTKSGIVANLDVIEYRAMVQLANGATDQAVITATSALQQIANKANSDLSNVASVASSFKEQSVGWGMPDYTAEIALTSGSNPPQLGYVMFVGNDIQNDYALGYIDGVNVFMLGSSGYQGSETAGMYLVNELNTITTVKAKIKFYPLKGVNQ